MDLEVQPIEKSTSTPTPSVSSNTPPTDMINDDETETNLERPNKRLKSVYDEEEGIDALAKMIILHEYPLSIVDHTGFKAFTTTIQPLFKCPSRNSIKSYILKIYEQKKTEVIDMIESVQSRVAITTDMWTSSTQKKSFMSITAHFIDENWILQSRILRFVYVPCPHTSEVLTDVLMDVLMEWNVDTKLSTITVDNCTTNDSLIGKIKDKLQLTKLMHDGSHIHMRCCANILDLVVNIGLDVIKSAIENVRESVAFWTATPNRLEKFEEGCKQLRISYDKKLGLDCPTRWNSTFIMLQTALMYKDVFARLHQRESHYKSLPSQMEWENAKEICEKLEVFYRVTELFSGTKYPTAYLFFPEVCDIRLALIEWIDCSNHIVGSMALKMIDKFDEYWGVIHQLMGVATILDPRSKMKMIEFYFPLIYPHDYKLQIQKIRMLCDELVKEYQQKFDESFGNEESTLPVSNCSVTKNLSSWQKHLLKKSCTPSKNVKSDLECYLEEDILFQSDDCDILMWWKLSGVKYPVLQAMARDILAIPVSTVASKSAFSASGRLITPHRSRLYPNTIETLMCAQSWLWSTTSQVENCTTMLDDNDADEAESTMTTMKDKVY